MAARDSKGYVSVNSGCLSSVRLAFWKYTRPNSVASAIQCRMAGIFLIKKFARFFPVAGGAVLEFVESGNFSAVTSP